MSKSTLVFAIGAILIFIGLGMALASVAIPSWTGILIAACAAALVVYQIWADHRDQQAVRARLRADGFSDGDSVEVDCRLCGQFNRVPAIRLRDHPICGRCKTRLMPGRRIVLCRASMIEGRLRDDLDELWLDEDRLWGCLANHLILRRHADAKRRGIMVN